MKPIFRSIICFFCMQVVVYGQVSKFTKDDTLLGSNTSLRSWWDVLHYDINVKPDYTTKSIFGNVTISFTVIKQNDTNTLQIDLQEPLIIDSVFYNATKFINYTKQKNRYFFSLPFLTENSNHKLLLYYHGIPKVARNAPWDGGWVWKKDSLGNPWMSVACQGIGASVWFPCKDIQLDEPDNGATLTIVVPDSLVAIGNGNLTNTQSLPNNFKSYTWQVLNSINSYDIIPYIGKYSLLKDTLVAELGVLQTNYWVLNYHKKQALQHLKPNVTKTLSCLEYWFGPYPFYNDSYKIVEAPYLGMEHQSNIAYGNNYLNGYAGSDLSKTGWGLKWDFIVVHETAHEWFGNSVTAADVADNWIHEGFASYAEVLFTECEFGKEAGNDYCEGVKQSIKNDIPIIGNYNVKREGSDDMYNKGSAIIHMIRVLMNNDVAFRVLLRDISKQFYHTVASTEQLEAFIIAKTGLQLTSFFEQYLRTTQLPILNYKIKRKKLYYKYSNCLANFNLPLQIVADTNYNITPTKKWQILVLKDKLKKISVDRNMYVKLNRR